MEKQQLYRVKVEVNPRCKKNQIKGGFLFNPELKQICEYTRGEAIKKAAAFGGKIEKTPAKVVKKESFKLWITIEKLTEYADGSEEYTDVKEELTEAYPLSRTGAIETLEDAEQRALDISQQINPPPMFYKIKK